MSKTTAGYVKKNLDVTFNEGNSPLELEDLVGLSIRRNPKRAHLLVSDVLGKHVPQNPAVIEFAGKVLGAMVGNILNGREEDTYLKPCFKVLHEYLHEGNKRDVHNDWWNTSQSKGHEVLPSYLRGWKKWDLANERWLKSQPKNKQKVAVVGYAETATALGFLVASQLDSWYVHSTRFYTDNDTAYGTFEESHSHATSHQLIPFAPVYLNSTVPVVLVDDEISTGNTAMNTIVELESVHHHDRYIIASLVDCRNDAHKLTMEKFAAEHGVTIEVVSLAQGSVSLPEDVLSRASGIIESASTPSDMQPLKKQELDLRLICIPTDDLALSKHGVFPRAYMEDLAAVAASDILWRSSLTDNTVVLGLEEFMYFPLMVAKELRKNKLAADFSSTTQSPVAVIDDPEYAIRNVITFNNPEGEKRFAYNIAEGYNRAVIVVEPGGEIELAKDENSLVAQLAAAGFDKIVIVIFKKEDVTND